MYICGVGYFHKHFNCCVSLNNTFFYMSLLLIWIFFSFTILLCVYKYHNQMHCINEIHYLSISMCKLTMHRHTIIRHIMYRFLLAVFLLLLVLFSTCLPLTNIIFSHHGIHLSTFLVIFMFSMSQFICRNFNRHLFTCMQTDWDNYLANMIKFLTA